MSLRNILDEVLREGLGDRKASRERLDHSSQKLQGAPGVDRVLGELQRMLSGDGQGGSLGGRARDFLKSEQGRGLTGGQIGGIGAAAGLLFGGGLGGAARGGALAILGTLAYNAYRRAQGAPGGEPRPEELRALTGPDTERLLVKAMIGAANADGQVTQEELDRILAKLDGEAATAEERQFVSDQLSRPATPAEIAAGVTGLAKSAEVYAAALVAIDLDSEAERQYLRDLAQALKLDPETVAYLHEQTGAPKL